LVQSHVDEEAVDQEAGTDTDEAQKKKQRVDDMLFANIFG
jgi:hypothetical protein